MTAMELTEKIFITIVVSGWLVIPFTLIGIHNGIDELCKIMKENNKKDQGGEW